MAVKQYELVNLAKTPMSLLNEKFNNVTRQEVSWLPEFDARTCFRIDDGLPSLDVRTFRLAVDRFCDDTALCKVYMPRL